MQFGYPGYINLTDPRTFVTSQSAASLLTAALQKEEFSRFVVLFATSITEKEYLALVGYNYVGAEVGLTATDVEAYAAAHVNDQEDELGAEDDDDEEFDFED